jgi:hypothetical protein
VPPIVVPDQCLEWRDFLGCVGKGRRVVKWGSARLHDRRTASVDWACVVMV